MTRVNSFSCVIVGLAICLFPMAVAAQLQQPEARSGQLAEDGRSASDSFFGLDRERTVSQGQSQDGSFRTQWPPLKRPRSSNSQSGDQERTDPTGSAWSILGALGFVILLILAMAKLLKKHGRIAIGGIPPEAIDFLGRRNIDQRQAIHLVRCGSRILVVGSSPNGLSTLAEVTDPVEVDYLAGLCRQSGKDMGMVQTFRQMFARQSPVEDVSLHAENFPIASQEGQTASKLPNYGSSSSSKTALKGGHG